MVMAKLENCLKITRVNLKLSLLSNVILAIIFLIMTPLIFNIKNTDSLAAAHICESFISLIGVILLVPIFLPEEKENIREVVECKKTNQEWVYLIRIIISILTMLILIVCFIGLLKFLGGNFEVQKYIYGTFSTALFLGGLGLIAVSITRQVVIGYMVPMGYFIIDMMTKGKYTKSLFLFSMVQGDFRTKNYLFVVGLALIVLALIIHFIRRCTR